ncbi:hypothetical protein KC19_8G180800 [Ceratodon purpureus]|uniref:PPIase cyclophilin-type domain-containing protein n=1 Tax=Ceratodon purpureus TaxID=3225 RepID=A0A8T0GZP6_CERPU|nr:hypothetical protein KC19_8G180800 [Ceratodon purpureus]
MLWLWCLVQLGLQREEVVARVHVVNDVQVRCDGLFSMALLLLDVCNAASLIGVGLQVDRGFVAQVADVIGGREAPLNAEQRAEGEKTVPGEFSKVKHVRGILSMGRYSDPDSAGSSFSMLLGNAPHLDGQYAVFGKVTKGDEVLSKLEELPTRKEGIFVMPLQRISILSTYYYDIEESNQIVSCKEQVEILKKRLIEANNNIQIERTKCLP